MTFQVNEPYCCAKLIVWINYVYCQVVILTMCSFVFKNEGIFLIWCWVDVRIESILYSLHWLSLCRKYVSD